MPKADSVSSSRRSRAGLEIRIGVNGACAWPVPSPSAPAFVSKPGPRSADFCSQCGVPYVAVPNWSGTSAMGIAAGHPQRTSIYIAFQLHKRASSSVSTPRADQESTTQTRNCGRYSDSHRPPIHGRSTSLVTLQWCNKSSPSIVPWVSARVLSAPRQSLQHPLELPQHSASRCGKIA